MRYLNVTRLGQAGEAEKDKRIFLSYYKSLLG